MKLVVIKSDKDEFEKAKQLLERDLTPKEQRWLTLADEILAIEKRRSLKLQSKAA